MTDHITPATRTSRPGRKAPPADLSSDDLDVVWRFRCGVDTGGPWTIEVDELVGTWGGRYFYVDLGDSADGRDEPRCAGAFDDVLEGIREALRHSGRNADDRRALWARSEEGRAEIDQARASLGWGDVLERLRDRRLWLHVDARGVLHQNARCLRALQHQPVGAEWTLVDDLLDDTGVVCCRTCLRGVRGLLDIVTEVDALDPDDAEPDEWETIVMTRRSGPPNLLEDLFGRMVYCWTAVDAVRQPIILASTVPPQVVEVARRAAELATELRLGFAYELDPTFEQHLDIGPDRLPRRYLGGFVLQPVRVEPARPSVTAYPCRRGPAPRRESAGCHELPTDWPFPARCTAPASEQPART